VGSSQRRWAETGLASVYETYEQSGPSGVASERPAAARPRRGVHVPVARPHQPGRPEPALDLRPVVQTPLAVVDRPVIAFDYKDVSGSSAVHDGGHHTAAVGAGTTAGTKPTSDNPRKRTCKEGSTAHCGNAWERMPF
jgi:hypothetical protein